MTESAEKKHPSFSIVNQYAKDVSLESPVPAFAKEASKLGLNMDVQIGTRAIQEDLYETVLRIKIKASNEEKVVCYLVEADYAGLFKVSDLEEKQRDILLHVDASTLIYPFARQLIMSLVQEAGYPAPQLAPINFAALYAQNNQKNQDSATK